MAKSKTLSSTGLTESAEDYLEAIQKILGTKKVVRVKDISKALNVKMPSVNAAMKALQKKGLIEQERYGYITLTDTGTTYAKQIIDRHELLFRFLHNVLRVDDKVAGEDACRIEHAISPVTAKRIVALTNFIEKKYPDGKWQ